MEQEETTYIISGVPNRPDLEGMELTGPELDDFISDEEVFNIIGGHVREKTQPHKNWDESISGLKETGENVQNMIEEAVTQRDLGPSGWGIKRNGKVVPLNNTELRKTLNDADQKGMNKLLKSGRLMKWDSIGDFIPATKEDVEGYPYLRPELPQSQLEISSAETGFKFPSFNDITDWMVRPGGLLTSSRERFINDPDLNPYKKMWQKKKDDGADENSEEMKNLERQAAIYGTEAEKNFNEALKNYNENEQPAALNFLGENLDVFDLATAPFSFAGIAGKLGKYGVTAPVKLLTKMGPKTRLGAEAALQTGLEAGHSAIEGENPVVGALGGGLSTLLPGAVGALRGGRLLKKSKLDDQGIMEQALGLMEDDASRGIRGRLNASRGVRGKVAEGIAHPSYSDSPLLSPADIDAEINKRIPANIQRGLQQGNVESLYPESVRLGDPRLTYTSLEGPRSSYPTEWAQVGPEEFDLKESWITDDLRKTIEDMYPEMSARGVKRKDLTSFKPGKEGITDVEKRIVDELPDVEDITLSDLLKALNEFKPKNQSESILKNRLLNKLGTTEVVRKPGEKYGLEIIHRSAPMIPDWEKTIEPRTGWGWWNLLNNEAFNLPKDLLREYGTEKIDEKFTW